ncbi:flavodoxin family protein [Clostridium estertheticum]|uniref:flavodoxin family protein n=1 Tax=Clostridium estertheticum TaxID=238834 RepID=UPI001C7D5FE7|nr:flavodoxin family protein [Clostridium estertheticum]MBX4266950.1 flavodoxin family protein [Clostridium estertheticum]MBX4271398.1 flavodoxin family protein [Clostridium estertheticum]WLC78818.1 flavodoxin family protein [Clostridium estertheticum]WLC89840.1 flavodoxin family protein [Clostridium estertheticum]
MKILALNGSPRGEKGNTEVILKQFLKGCKKAGAAIETVYLKDKNIKHCNGCFSCWTKTPGICIYKDDMEGLLVKVSEADIIVYATPLYYFTVTGIMKDFMDRMLPLNNSEIVKIGENYSHPRRVKREIPTKSILISNCGFPNSTNFSGLVETFKVMAKGNLAGSILCAQGGVLKSINTNDMLKNLYMPFFSALENAGEEIVQQGYIKTATQIILDKNVLDPETYVKAANRD